MSVIAVSGAVCSSSNLNMEDEKSCKDLDLNKASFLLKVFPYESVTISTFLKPFVLLHMFSYFLFEI